MTVLQITGLTADGWVQFDDGSGPTEVETSHVHEHADDDTDTVTIAGRTFATHTLWGLRNFLVELDMPRCNNCGDGPGTEDMGDGIRFCAACCSGAQGSQYDDRGTGI